MGKGKGAHFKWICPVRTGQIIMEFRFRRKSFLEILLLLRKCKKKLPMKVQIVSRSKKLLKNKFVEFYILNISKNFKNIFSKKHIKYLYILLLGMFVAAVIEMIGLGSIPMFIMIIIDLDVLISKFPNFFVNDYLKNLEQNYITIFGGIILILVFLLKNIYKIFCIPLK